MEGKREREQEPCEVVKKVKTEPSVFSYLKEESWKKLLEKELKDKKIDELESFLSSIPSATTVYPPKENIFKALNELAVDKVKCVILGQDTYFNGQANGLAFSVNKGVTPPPS